MPFFNFAHIKRAPTDKVINNMANQLQHILNVRPMINQLQRILLNLQPIVKTIGNNKLVDMINRILNNKLFHILNSILNKTQLPMMNKNTLNHNLQIRPNNVLYLIGERIFSFAFKLIWHIGKKTS